MISIIKDIIDVAKALRSFLEGMQKANKQKRNDMADYFEKISVCLEETYKSLKKDINPLGRCFELLGYGEQLPKVVEGIIDKEKAEELTTILTRSHKVERLREQFINDPKKKKDLPKIAEASGIFLALSNSIRVGYKL